MKRLLSTLVIIGLATSLRADVTNVIDIAALAACQNGVTNGWTLSGIDSYSDQTSIRLNGQNDCLDSPDFGATVRQIILKVKSSSQSGRRLTFIPYVDDEPSSANASTCDYSSNKDTYVRQTVAFPDTLATTRFRIALVGDGSTAWGFSSLAVVTATSKRFASPDKLTVDRLTADAATVSWEHNNLVASNRVTIASVTSVPETFTVITNYDFELCVNAGTGDSEDKSEDLHARYPDFTAEKAYYPAQSTGQLRISSGKANGRLTHCGYPAYQNMAIDITAKRYAGDTTFSKISAYYLDDGQHTNEIGSISIGDDFTTGRISLSGVPGNTAINLGNLDGYRSNRRFIIDRIAFLDNYSPAATVTNIIRTTVTTTDICRINGLAPRTRYLVTVTAIDASGNLATPSPPTSFTTPTPSGTILTLY